MFASFPYPFVGFGGVLDGAQGLPLVLQFVVEQPQLGGGVAGLLVDSFAPFVAHVLPGI